MSNRIKLLSVLLVVLLLSLFGCSKYVSPTISTDSNLELSHTDSGDDSQKEETPPEDTTQIQSEDVLSVDAELSQEALTSEDSVVPEAPTTPTVDEDGSYTSAEDVALYIHVYKKLPSNFITKNEARKLGWEGGGLDKYSKGKCIGGDRFGNYEGLLPEKSGRFYTECDIDTLGKSSRGAKRIVFSNDGLIYYTEDHYESFVLLYGEE